MSLNLDPKYYTINTNKDVYITMSTIPSRLQNTLKVIKHLCEHLKGFKKIILNVPYKYKRFPNYIVNTNHNIKDNRFMLNRCEDNGPITKILPSLQIIPDNSITIICDDMCYNLEAFKDIAEMQDNNLQNAYSYYVYNYNGIGVPQGADLISFYTEKMEHFIDWFNEFSGKRGDYFQNPCFFVDDQIIGYYFQYIGVSMEQVDRKHRMIYLKNCVTGPEKDNLNRQIGKHHRDNVMEGCFKELSKLK